MLYQCSKCQKQFTHPAKQTDYSFNNIAIDDFLQSASKEFMHPGDFTVTSQIEAAVCPFCRSREYAEFIDPVVSERKTVGVLVVDLVTGDNIALNKALADGYEIVGRYAKQYTLEKKEPLGQQNNAYVTLIVNPKLKEEGYKITLTTEGKQVVFTNCQLQEGD
jgi:hypothetical protein